MGGISVPQKCYRRGCWGLSGSAWIHSAASDSPGHKTLKITFCVTPGGTIWDAGDGTGRPCARQMPSPWWCYCPAPVPALTGVNAETIPNARGPTRSPPVGGPSPACLSWWPQDRDPCRESRHSCPPGLASKVVGKPDTSGATENAEKQKQQSRFLLWKERFPPREAERGESWQRWKPQPPYSLPASGPAPLLPCTSLATPRPPAGRDCPVLAAWTFPSSGTAGHSEGGDRRFKWEMR